jgi:hypothetical protein
VFFFQARAYYLLINHARTLLSILSQYSIGLQKRIVFEKKFEIEDLREREREREWVLMSADRYDPFGRRSSSPFRLAFFEGDIPKRKLSEQPIKGFDNAAIEMEAAGHSGEHLHLHPYLYART